MTAGLISLGFPIKILYVILISPTSRQTYFINFIIIMQNMFCEEQTLKKYEERHYEISFHPLFPAWQPKFLSYKWL
jgi:hypothetical protein